MEFIDIIFSDQHCTSDGDMSQCWVLCPCVTAQVKDSLILHPCIQVYKSLSLITLQLEV